MAERHKDTFERAKQLLVGAVDTVIKMADQLHSQPRDGVIVPWDLGEVRIPLLVVQEWEAVEKQQLNNIEGFSNLSPLRLQGRLVGGSQKQKGVSIGQALGRSVYAYNRQTESHCQVNVSIWTWLVWILGWRSPLKVKREAAIKMAITKAYPKLV